jgi:beta-glucosidase
MMQMFHSSRLAVCGLLVGSFIVAGVAPVALGFDSSLVTGRAPPSAQEVAWPAVKSPVTKDPRLEARITALLGQLTLEQKVAQMVQADIRYATPDDVRKYHLGSILNGGGAFPGNNKHAAVADWVALADRFYDASMDASQGGPAIPVFWGTDAVHGHNNVIGATLFPHNVGLGAAHDPDLIQRIGEATATEVAVTGIDWAFAPTVAVVRDGRWGRAYEGYSDRPDIVRAYAGRMVQGLQGAPGTASFLDNNHVLATAKHFIGDGGTDRGVDHGDNLSSEQELLDIHAQGYIAALESGVQTVMVSYNSWQGPKLHGQHYLITEVLKNRMGFDGLVVSDWNGIDEVQGCTVSSCAQAVNAGIDLFMVPLDWKAFIANTVAQVRAGDIPESRIDDAVTRILRVKIRAGLFEKGRPSSRSVANNRALLGAPEHRAVAREAVRKSLVLLKNDGALLPLRRRSHVLVAGDGADSIEKQTGGWTLTWQGTGNSNAEFPGATSIFEGIHAAVGAAGGTATLSADGGYRSRPDVAIVVFGENPYAEWHGDIKSLDFRGADGSTPPDLARPWPETPMPGQWAPPVAESVSDNGARSGGAADAAAEEAATEDPNLQLVRRLRHSGIPVVMVFLAGRPRGITPELQASSAFVVAWLPGTEGAGIADVLFRNNKGAVNFDFTGKLSYSWPAGGGPEETHSASGPLCPYGYGLTYCNQHCDAPLSRQPWQTQQSLTSRSTPASP